MPSLELACNSSVKEREGEKWSSQKNGQERGKMLTNVGTAQEI